MDGVDYTPDNHAFCAPYQTEMLQPTLPALTKPFLLGMGVVPESIPTRAGSTATTGGAGPSQILGATATATALETRLATLAAEGAVQPPEGVPGCWEVQGDRRHSDSIVICACADSTNSLYRRDPAFFFHHPVPTYIPDI